MRTRFVILCLGRSGSNHLISLLDSHPEVRSFGELFSDRAPREAPAFIHCGHDDARGYLQSLLASQRERVVGFKLPMNSIRAHPVAAELVAEDPDLRVIRLSRRNLLEQFVSRRMQATTRVSHSLQGEYGEATVAIDPARALNALERMEADELELDGYARGKPTFRIDYEQLASERVDELQRFLGLEPQPLRSWFTKLRTRPLSETVENWEELAGALRGTAYERFLPSTA